LKLWAGQTVSTAGSLVTGFALPLAAIVLLHASAAQVALLSAAGIAPRLVLALVVGVWADRAKRRPLLIVADVGRAVVIASVAAAALLGRLRMEQLYAVALASSALSVLFDVAHPAYLASLVGPEDLVEANSKLEASSAMAEAVGLGAAGALVQVLTAPLALAVDAGSYVISALSLALIRTHEPRPKGDQITIPNEGRRTRGVGLWRQIVDGLHLLLGDPTVRALAGAAGVFALCGNMLGVVLLLYLVREVHLEAGLLGTIFGLGGVSAFVGSLMAGHVTRRWGIGRAVIGGLAIYTGVAVALPLASGPAWLAAGLLALEQLSDGAHAVYSVGRASLLQALAPAEALGRLHASILMVEAVATLAGVALGGILGQALGPRPTLFVAVAAGLLAPLWLACSPLRALPRPPVKTGRGVDQGGLLLQASTPRMGGSSGSRRPATTWDSRPVVPPTPYPQE
jgi:MFS family permease